MNAALVLAVLVVNVSAAPVFTAPLIKAPQGGEFDDKRPKTELPKKEKDTVFQESNLKVKRHTGRVFEREFSWHTLLFNRINIGTNFRKPAQREDHGDPEKDRSRMATTYFHREGPIGIVMDKFNWNSVGKPNTYHADARLSASLVWTAGFDPYTALVNLWSEPPVAVVDMDVGSMASYARPMQTMHFFEENPAIVKLSLPDKGKERHFDLIHDAMSRGAGIKVFEGAPRATIEKEAGIGFYHAIVINTYKLPVVTVHKDLLTKEGMRMLMDRTVPEGILCYHTSNRYYNLVPVIASVAADLGYVCKRGHDVNDSHEEGHFSSEWVMVARKAEHLRHLEAPPGYDEAVRRKRPFADRYWTAPEVNKKHVWTDKGENSFKGVYYGDPAIGELGMILYDVQDLLADEFDPVELHRFMEPIHGALREFSSFKARLLNADSKKKAPIKKEKPRSENERNIEIKTYATRFEGKEHPYDMVLFHRTVIGMGYHKPAAREDIGKPDRDLSRLATSYYHPHSPVGLALQKFNWFPGPRNTYHADARLPSSLVALGPDPLSELVQLWSEPPVAHVGLEVGTLASYARPGQPMHFFARVPELVKMSLPDAGQPRLPYLQDAIERGAALRIFEGELRPTFEAKAGDGFYQVIAVEIYKEPDHNLLKDVMTREALQLFVRKLAPGGVICFHVSSRHYNLVPILASAAKELNCVCLVGRYHDDGESPGAYSAEWVVVGRTREDLAHLKAPPGYAERVKEPYWREPPLTDKFFVWTDSGENSLRGVYLSDPAVDQWRWVWDDIRFWMRDRFEVEVFQYTRWMDDLFWAWTMRSAEILNRGAPVAKKVKN